ncbi:hypothetical protein NBRC116591_32090 [Sessilibacter corallicola]|uniref:Integrase catalytic domain-containing protein n=1 Tax=Sessilibacter corallicola TaxID=2904075 RepID=A0ABQ0ACL4_9GAMM
MYNQLTYEERVTFSTLKLQGLSIRKIATVMGRHFSTLYRELNRNRCHIIDGAYRPSKAERRTRARRRRSRRNKHFSQDDFQCVTKLLTKKWSPEQISERPLSLENKRFLGHWEIDTVFGKGSKHCIMTQVERKSKYLLIGKLPNKSARELNQRALKLILQNASWFKTITADNGTEFHQYKTIEELSGVTFSPRLTIPGNED